MKRSKRLEWKHIKLLMTMVLWMQMTLEWVRLYPEQGMKWLMVGMLGAFLIQQRLFNGEKV